MFMLFLIKILPVRAEVRLAPRHHGLQDGEEALAEFCERIFHFRRDFPVDFPVEEPVAFQLPELCRELLLV